MAARHAIYSVQVRAFASAFLTGAWYRHRWGKRAFAARWRARGCPTAHLADRTNRTNRTKRGLVCKHPYPRAKIRQSVCEPSFAHRASGSPASAQPAWERICAAGRGETAALKMPPPRPGSGTKTPEVFSGVKRPEGEHWRRERSRRAADASAGALILKDKLTTTIFTCRRRNGGVRGGTRRGVPLRTARPSAVPRGIQRRGVLRYCRST